MTTQLVKIKFVCTHDVLFHQYYSINCEHRDQLEELKKLNYTQDNHLCSGINTCSFCKFGFTEVSYANYIEDTGFLLTECDFVLSRLIQIVKDQEHQYLLILHMIR